MDTGSKNFNFTAVRKFIALILCLVSVAVMVNQTMTSIIKADEQELTWANAGDAVFHDLKEGIWDTNTFRLSFNSYINTLSSAIGKYGDGSEKAYKEKTDYINSYNKEIKKQAKKNLVRYLQAKNICYEYLVAINDGVITTLEKIGDSDSSTELKYDYYDNVLENDELDYEYIAHGEFDRSPLTIYSEIKEAAEALGADGVVKLDYKCVILKEDIYTDESVTYKVYEPGYYAFKINTEVLYEKLYQSQTLIQNDVLTYETFKSDRKYYTDEIEKYYDTGRYYIKDSKGRVYTNMKNLSASSTEAQVAAEFGKLSFYCIENGYGDMLTAEGRHYVGASLSDDGGENYYYSGVPTEVTDVQEQTTVYDTTTLPPQVTTMVVYAETQEPTTAAPAVPAEVETSYSKETVPYYDRTPFISSGDVICYVGVDMENDPLSEDNAFFRASRDIARAELIIRDFIITCGILAVQFIICFIYLLLKSGRRKHGDERVYLFKADRIFSEIRIAFDVVAATLLGACIYEVLENYEYMESFFRFALVALCVVFTAVVLDFILFCTRHLKNRSFLSNFFVVWIIKKSAGKVKKLAENVRAKLYYVTDLRKPVFIKTAIVVAVNVAVGLMTIASFWIDGALVLVFTLTLFFFDLFVLYRGLVFTGGVHKLFNVIGEMRKGNLEEEINKNALPWYLLPHAENLQGLGEGLKVAVEEAVKQEQTKTELITNVSHDLKTPLTSIINYVDLLKKCDITDETALSYLQVLSEKSDRLKYLISDLVEASKASAGALPVNLVDMSLLELLGQLIGEFEEDFEKRGLNIIFDAPQGDVVVKADGKHLYRVMENLFVNVRKYALSGSRVYVSIGTENGKGIITVKNISAEPLNIPATELKSRFVRGDRSRTTEGNGLGLSIAENLCTLQGGNLILEINGDLFVAKVEMVTANR